MATCVGAPPEKLNGNTNAEPATAEAVAAFVNWGAAIDGVAVSTRTTTCAVVLPAPLLAVSVTGKSPATEAVPVTA